MRPGRPVGTVDRRTTRDDRFPIRQRRPVGRAVERGRRTNLVDRILRPVLDYDEQHNSRLVETLDAFLQNQRSWQQTAQAMHIHRQTVMYRIRKVEALTSRDLADTNSLSELWLAVRAAELLYTRDRDWSESTDDNLRPTPRRRRPGG